MSEESRRSAGAAALSLQPVDSIGKRTVRGFSHAPDGTPVYEWEEDVFPPNPNGAAMKQLRQQYILSIATVASALNITQADVYALEGGWKACDWQVLFAALLEKFPQLQASFVPCTCDSCEHEFTGALPELEDPRWAIVCPVCGSGEVGWSEYNGDD